MAFENVNDKLLELKKQRDAQKIQEVQPQAVQEEIKVEETPAKPIEDKAKSEEAVPAPEPSVIDSKKEDTSTTTQTPENEVDEPEFSWDSDLETESPKQSDSAPSFDIKKIGSALNLDVDSEQDLISKVSERITKLKQLEEKTSKLESIPSDLKEVFEQSQEIAAKGGDWQSYIYNTLTDPSKLDPIELFEQAYERDQIFRFKKEDGSVDWDAFDAELDSIPNGMKSLQGKAIKDGLMRKHQAQREAVLNEVTRKQEQFNRGLVEAVKELPTYLPKDEFGIVIEPKHTSATYEGIASGKLIEKHLGKLDAATLAKLDPKKLAKTLFLAENGKNISQFRYKQGVTQGKRELLNRNQNIDIQRSGVPAAPELTDEQRPKTSVEKLKELKARQTPPNSL